jgi:phospholipid-binding lipoprotein MlaA
LYATPIPANARQTPLNDCSNPETMRILVARAAAIVLCAAMTGCAGLATREAGPDDPLEPLNRVVFSANLVLDDAVIRPIAEVYRATLPKFVRDRIRAAIDNLAEPRIFVNDLLQGRINSAGITFTRFLVNTIGGLGGAFDLATGQGFPRQTGDFGQTLYAWGADDGPYLVILFFGPSNARDAFGLGIDLVTTPPALVVHGHAGEIVNLTVGAVDGMDLRSRNIETLDEIKAEALDFYSRMRSLWQQQRKTQLRDARERETEPEELIDPGARDSPPR